MTPSTPMRIVTKSHSMCQFTIGNDDARALHSSAGPCGRQSTSDQADLHRGQRRSRLVSILWQSRHALPRLPAAPSARTKSP
jgi:hypothetical protein